MITAQQFHDFLVTENVCRFGRRAELILIDVTKCIARNEQELLLEVYERASVAWWVEECGFFMGVYAFITLFHPEVSPLPTPSDFEGAECYKNESDMKTNEEMIAVLLENNFMEETEEGLMHALKMFPSKSTTIFDARPHDWKRTFGERTGTDVFLWIHKNEIAERMASILREDNGRYYKQRSLRTNQEIGDFLLRTKLIPTKRVSPEDFHKNPNEVYNKWFATSKSFWLLRMDFGGITNAAIFKLLHSHDTYKGEKKKDELQPAKKMLSFNISDGNELDVPLDSPRSSFSPAVSSPSTHPSYSSSKTSWLYRFAGRIFSKRSTMSNTMSCTATSLVTSRVEK